MAFEKRVEPSHSPSELEIQESKLVLDGQVKGKRDFARQDSDSHSTSVQGGAATASPDMGGALDPAVDVDLVIATLRLPECGAEVSRIHSNEHTADKQVQAYAKLAGRNWTYYVQQLEIVIGRSAADSTDRVDIDLAPSKIVSRRHAVIRYNLSTRHWEVVSFGRNGLRLDGTAVRAGNTVTLSSGNVLDIGNVQMMFVLPDADPVVAPMYLQKVRAEQEAHYASQKRASELSMAMRNSSSLGGQPGPMSESSAYPRGVTIVSRPQVPSSHYLVQDLASDDCKDIKPPFSYATMISQAILSTSEHMMTLADIYAWISSHYAFYRYSKPGWQNSIRHNLSLNKAFEKVARKENEPGKGSKWHIVGVYKDELIKKATTGRPTDAGSYAPRRPYEDSPPPVTGRKRSHTEITLVQVKDESNQKPLHQLPVQEQQQPHQHQQQQQQQRLHPAPSKQDTQQNQRDLQQQQEPQDQNQNQPQQRQQRQQQMQMPIQYMPQQFQVPHGQQQSFQLPVPMQNMSGSSFPVQSFQYMTPFGMSYYPPQPGQQMMPMVHMPTQQVSGQQTNQPDQSSPELSKQSIQGSNSAEPVTGSGPVSRHGSESESHEETSAAKRQNTRSDRGSWSSGGSTAEHNDNAGITESNSPGTKPSELQTPARAPKPELRNHGETPVLGSAVKLPPDQGPIAPESSPALWKYMNLESTPNNATPAGSRSGRNESQIENQGDGFSPARPAKSNSAANANHSEHRGGHDVTSVHEPLTLIENMEHGNAA